MLKDQDRDRDRNHETLMAGVEHLHPDGICECISDCCVENGVPGAMCICTECLCEGYVMWSSHDGYRETGRWIP